MTLKLALRELLFESDSHHNKVFDIFLAIIIVCSVFTVALESVDVILARAALELHIIEAVFTAFFTLEYLARIYAAKNRAKYIKSFYGIIDLLAILPLYIGLIIPAAKAGSAIRILRLFRLFRLLKMFHIVDETNHLAAALKRSAPKIAVFIMSVMLLSIITGSLLSIVEEGEGFENIFQGIFFTVNLLTTIGYTDIVPETVTGRVLASFIVLIGYGIIAVPTGVVTVEFIKHHRTISKALICASCNTQNDADSKFCKQCGNAF